MTVRAMWIVWRDVQFMQTMLHKPVALDVLHKPVALDDRFGEM